jgi:hypothetical protein
MTRRVRTAPRPAAVLRRGARFGVGVVLVVVLGACGGTDDDIVGVWQPDDGSAPKMINGDGSCSAMYYNDGVPLDIGGPMTCSFSEKTDSAGAHTMLVQQPPNHETLQVMFTDADTAEVSQGGQLLFTMRRE